MRGGAVFVAFFLLFTLATLAVPVPLFPGSMIHAVFGIPDINPPFISAITNGVTYGLFVWLVFFLATRNLDESTVSNYKGKKSSNQRGNKKRSVKN